MRTIKFRAWFELNKKMVESESLALSYDGEDLFDFAFDKDTVADDGNMKGTLNFTLMQFTGLKDVNGVEIYEGDILKIVTPDYDLFQSVYFESHGYFSTNEFALFELIRFDSVTSFEVIGNIYKNPELLEPST